MPIEVIRNAYYLREPHVCIYLGGTRLEVKQKLPNARLRARELSLLRSDPWYRVRAALWGSMKRRAGERGSAMMTKEEFATMWARADGRCEVTDLPFDLTKLEGRLKRPWAPSVDRRDCTLGYEASNCRIVCTAVNLAMNEWGEETLRRIAVALARRVG